MRRMRVRVIASRTSVISAERRENGASIPVSVPTAWMRRAMSLRARTISETPLMTWSISSTGRRIVRCSAAGAASVGRRRPTWTSGRSLSSAVPLSAAISASSAASESGSPRSISSIITPMRSITASTASTSRLSALAAVGAHVGERVLGGVAQRLELREIEEAAVAFDGVDEAEDRIEPRAVRRVGFPGDDLARQRGEHLARFGDEFRQQIVHCSPSPNSGRTAMGAMWLRGRLRIVARIQPREICVSCSVMNSTSAGCPASIAAIARLSAGTISAASVTRSPWQPSERAKAA